ncbi:hypothetical protein [Streptomyces thermodiastaticus]|jgi:hypothetical protein|nr:hypothetical protein [Streptomyces thermodiastaticus]GHF86379.1 hypothetical protein GCM10018787_38930 [Streptomyces thermodiastaticus]
MILQGRRLRGSPVRRTALWTGVMSAGTAGWAVLALSRGEHIGAA